ncbi:MAG: helix-turn-helix domain-containing protein [Candidatus Tumulicola sp.]
MPDRLFDSAGARETTETAHQALGRFLRKRREAISPEQVGIVSRRGRRTPGLRREEVAFLADIGVKWYARVEAGDEIHPSESTLIGIAAALQLSSAEFEYMLELAGLRRPSPFDGAESEATIPSSFPALLGSLRGVAVTVTDKILTPLRWNALADAMYGHTRHEHPVERNGLIRALFDPALITFLGAEREEFVFRAVGMLRLNHSSRRPSPFASAVYERSKGHVLFQRAWNRRTVAGESMDENVAVRNHPLVGSLAVYFTNCSAPIRPDLILRMMAPADEDTAWKFKQLQDIGTDWVDSTDRNETLRVGRMASSA